MTAMKLMARQALVALALAFASSQAALAALPIQQWNLANGARVWLVESHGIPMVDVQLDFDAGARRDPAGKSGLAGVSARMTSKGHCRGRPRCRAAPRRECPLGGQRSGASHKRGGQ